MNNSSVPHEDVVVYTAMGRLAGEMIRVFLESKNIPAYLSQEGAGLTYGFTVGLLGEVDILVAADRADEAKDLLARMEAGEFELPDGEDSD